MDGGKVRKVGTFVMLALLSLVSAGCGMTDLRGTIADIVSTAKNGLVVPAAPTGLTAAATSPSGIHLSWTDNSNNETSFVVERSSDGANTWTEAQATGANVTSWDDAGLTAGGTYYYRVKARNGTGDSAYSNTANAATSQSLPAAPSGLVADGSSTTSIHLSWVDNSSNESSFRIERSPDGISGWTALKDVAANTTSWDDTGLSTGTPYSYRVKAMNSAGDTQYTNTASTSTFFTPVVAINAAGDSFLMSGSVSETISYNYYMQKNLLTVGEFAPFITDGGYVTQSYWTANGWSAKTSGKLDHSLGLEHLQPQSAGGRGKLV